MAPYFQQILGLSSIDGDRRGREDRHIQERMPENKHEQGGSLRLVKRPPDGPTAGLMAESRTINPGAHVSLSHGLYCPLCLVGDQQEPGRNKALCFSL